MARLIGCPKSFFRKYQIDSIPNRKALVYPRSSGAKGKMSELIVIGFREPHRGLEVMSELWRLSEGLMTDLEEAVVLSWNAQGKLIVRQNVNLSTGEGVTWGRFWGAFIRSTLLCEGGNRRGRLAVR